MANGNFGRSPQTLTSAVYVVLPLLQCSAFVTLGSAPTSTRSRFEMANGRTVRQGGSDIDELRNTQGIFDFNAKVPNSTVDLGVAKQQLDRSEVAGLSINLGCLCPAERMGAVSAWL